MNREDSLSWYDAQKSAFMDGFYELLKLRTSKIIMLSRIAYYVRILSILQPQHSDFCGRDRLLMQINAYLDFNPFSLGFLGSNFPKE